MTALPPTTLITAVKEKGAGERKRKSEKNSEKKQRKGELFTCRIWAAKMGHFRARKPPRKKLRTANPKNPETQDLTSRKLFRDIFGSEKPNNRAKTWVKQHKKNTTNTDTKKQKFAPEKFFK